MRKKKNRFLCTQVGISKNYKEGGSRELGHEMPPFGKDPTPEQRGPWDYVCPRKRVRCVREGEGGG